MPGYKAHAAGAVVLGAGTLAAVNWMEWYTPDPLTALMLMGFVVLGSLFPDVDTDSVGQKLFYTILAIINLTFMVLGHYKWAAVLGFCAMLPVVARHRGWIHTWWAMFAVPMIIFIIPIIFYDIPWKSLLPFYFASVFGYFTHLLFDRKFV
ncbi:metal-dependent hydrolase [Desulfonatronovibrio magnus]|uniref:metal-dependent hydrolase n=1 Tax=Desulfonatronovibrio magnus TaxID=698827 RepID=UPI0005EB1CFE|nr:metal-dependent hydrolase [Desulfonatronovibrio magnus]